MSEVPPQGEIWKVIPEWPKYEASSLGSIRRAETERILKLRLNHKGYWFVGLRRDGKRFDVSVAKAVAQAFIGRRPEGLTINHIDAVRTNNRPENLEYCTQLQNRQHATAMGLNPTGDRNGSRTHPERRARGSRVGTSKFTEAQVSEMRKRHAAGERPTDIAKSLHTDLSNIVRILKRETWQHVA